MRTAFIEELTILAREDRSVFLVVGDLGFSVVENFAREFPDRFLNAGIAEQNMTGLAAGLASEGYRVFTYSIANFPTFRCAEQIRNDVAYHNLPVTIVAVGGGLAYGSLGYSHHAVQDMALMRTFPGILIGAPGDPAETRATMRLLLKRAGPGYLRLGKAGEPKVHPTGVEVEPGRLLKFGEVDSRPTSLLLSTGSVLALAHSACQGLQEGTWQLASLPLWGEETKAQVASELSKYRQIVTVEDHLRAGGFGSYIAEALSAFDIKISLKSIALDPRVCGQVASQKTLNQQGGLNTEVIRQALTSI